MFFLVIFHGIKKGLAKKQALKDLGDVLLSHTVASAVPSALRGLTAVFGMGTGVTPSLESPKTCHAFPYGLCTAFLPHAMERLGAKRPRG